MGVLARLFDLSKAAVNEALDKLEQPEMMLNYYVRNMQEEIHALQSALAGETAAAKKFEKEIAYYTSTAEQYEQKAGEAMADDRMAEARQAMEAKLGYMDKAEECKKAYAGSQIRVEELTKQLEQAKSQYASMQAKKDELTKRVRKMNEQTQYTSAATHHDIHSGSAVRGFGRIEEMILQEEMKHELEQAEKASAQAAREALIEEQLNRLRNEAPRQ